MTPTLEQDLIQRFGKFFDLEEQKKSYGCYFRCHDGWYVILFMFLLDIEKTGEDIKFGTVKEKYGWLRTYPDFSYCVGHRYSKEQMLHPSVLALIHNLEWKSYETCEFCGKTGVIRWDYEHVRVLCDSCVVSYDNPKRNWSDTARTTMAPGENKIRDLAGYGRK
jgi:hypothetical protein